MAEPVDQLSEMLSISKADAAALLARSGNDVDQAAANFFSEQAGEATQQTRHSDPRLAAAMDEDDDDGPVTQSKPNPGFTVPAASSSAAAAASGGAREPRRTGIATFSSLASSDDGGKKKDNEFYAGGKNSGIAVQGGGGEDRDSFFERAKAAGISMDEYEREEREETKKATTFKGLGYRLGETAAEPPQVEGQPLQQELESTPKPKKIKITFWKGGFSIDDGEEVPELRSLEDPRNKMFLSTVAQGGVPSELRRYGINIDVEVEDRHTEDFAPPKRPMKTFTGKGQRLGVPTPQVAGDGSGAASAASAAGAAGAAGAAAGGGAGAQDSVPPPKVDESRPITTVQLRLADGTRIVVQMNTEMTVGDLRRYVAAARPTQGRSFALLAGFPSKPLQDDNQTLEQAGLLKGVVHQKWV